MPMDLGTRFNFQKGWLGRSFWLWFTVLLSLVACQPVQQLPTENSFNSLPTITATIAVTTSPTASALRPTAVLLGRQEVTAVPQNQNLPTVAPDPLRFVFPTPGKPPVSAWRPPLYPIPWAPTLYDHFYFSRPIAADEINWPSQNYRYGGEFFEDVIHTGVDIPAPEGTPVLAAGPGEVVWTGYGLYRGGNDPSDPYGLAVAIHHDFGYQNSPLYTIYGHLGQVDVALGQHVETGDALGLVGETGRVTGPHLHFEVRLGGNDYFKTRNPELWIVPPMGWGVLAGRIMDSNGKLVPKQPIIVTSLANGQNWFGRSYGEGAVQSDPYYQENVAVGDLPAGVYQLRMAYAGLSFSQEIEIKPGLVNYFYFYGKEGFVLASPPGLSVEFSPELPATPLPLP